MSLSQSSTPTHASDPGSRSKGSARPSVDHAAPATAEAGAEHSAPPSPYAPAASRMARSSFESLEYPKILAQLTNYATSQAAKKVCKTLPVQDTVGAARAAMADTADALAYLYGQGTLPIAPYQLDPQLLDAAQKGFALSCADLLDIASFAKMSVDLLRVLPQAYPNCARVFEVYHKINRLYPLDDLYRTLDNAIENETDLKDSASPDLRRIRRNITQTQENIKRTLDKIVASHPTALQDQLVTMKEGRYVVPVRTDKKGEIPGIVHAASASGATTFIEPMAVVELNNHIRDLQIEEEQEIKKILHRLSAYVADLSDVLEANEAIIRDLDVSQAKALYAKALRAEPVTIREDTRLVLNKARHPLLQADKAVPLTLSMGDTYQMILITGPNTGGKTVCLKTVGLLSLMALAGLAIPADASSEIPAYSCILADIGDEQSIEQNLSTFSSHQKRIVDMCELADAHTLILLDEPGSGTDPAEGSALAMAILDYFRSKKASMVATSHYAELKVYAYNTPGIENACFEFDLETLQPTFRLLMGIPGSSNALAIAHRLHLPQAILDQAQSYLQDENQEFSKMLVAIEASHKEAAAMREEIARLKAEAERVNREVQAERTKLAQNRDKALAAAEEEALAIIDQAETEMKAKLAYLEDMIQESREEGKEISSARLQESLAQKRELSKKKEKIQQKVRYRANKSDRPLAPEDIVLGEEYLSKSLGVKGKAISLPDKDRKVTLQNGSLTITVPLHTLQVVEDESPEPAVRKRGKVKRLGALDQSVRDLMSKSSQEILPELDLHGCHMEEAMDALEDYLDKALLGGLREVRINHGKGTGALKAAVHRYLKDQPYVESYHLAPPNQGDLGVTIVRFK